MEKTLPWDDFTALIREHRHEVQILDYQVAAIGVSRCVSLRAKSGGKIHYFLNVNEAGYQPMALVDEKMTASILSFEAAKESFLETMENMDKTRSRKVWFVVGDKLH